MKCVTKLFLIGLTSLFSFTCVTHNYSAKSVCADSVVNKVRDINDGGYYYLKANIPNDTHYYFATGEKNKGTSVETTDDATIFQLNQYGTRWFLQFLDGKVLYFTSSQKNACYSVIEMSDAVLASYESYSFSITDVEGDLLRFECNGKLFQRNAVNSLNFGAYSSGQADIVLEKYSSGDDDEDVVTVTNVEAELINENLCYPESIIHSSDLMLTVTYSDESVKEINGEGILFFDSGYTIDEYTLDYGINEIEVFYKENSFLRWYGAIEIRVIDYMRCIKRVTGVVNPFSYLPLNKSVLARSILLNAIDLDDNEIQVHATHLDYDASTEGQITVTARYSHSTTNDNFVVWYATVYSHGDGTINKPFSVKDFKSVTEQSGNHTTQKYYVYGTISNSTYDTTKNTFTSLMINSTLNASNLNIKFELENRFKQDGMNRITGLFYGYGDITNDVFYLTNRNSSNIIDGTYDFVSFEYPYLSRTEVYAYESDGLIAGEKLIPGKNVFMRLYYGNNYSNEVINKGFRIINNGGDTVIEGENTIKALYREFSCEYTFTAQLVLCTGFSIVNKSLSLYEDNQAQMITFIDPSSGCSEILHWSSSNEDVATIDSNGLVTAISQGVATITGTIGSFTDTATVEVLANELTLEWTNPGNEIVRYVGERMFLEAGSTLTAKYSDPSIVDISLTLLNNNNLSICLKDLNNEITKVPAKGFVFEEAGRYKAIAFEYTDGKKTVQTEFITLSVYNGTYEFVWENADELEFYDGESISLDGNQFLNVVSNNPRWCINHISVSDDRVKAIIDDGNGNAKTVNPASYALTLDDNLKMIHFTFEDDNISLATVTRILVVKANREVHSFAEYVETFDFSSVSGTGTFTAFTNYFIGDSDGIVTKDDISSSNVDGVYGGGDSIRLAATTKVGSFTLNFGTVKIKRITINSRYWDTNAKINVNNDEEVISIDSSQYQNYTVDLSSDLSTLTLSSVNKRRLYIKSLSIVVSPYSATQLNGFSDETNSFIARYMHPEIPENYSGSGECITNSWYVNAKEHFNSLSTEAKNLFLTNDAYVKERNRLFAWAAAYGEELDEQTQTFLSTNRDITTLSSGQPIMISLILSVVAASSMASLTVVLSVKRKRSK